MKTQHGFFYVFVIAIALCMHSCTNLNWNDIDDMQYKPSLAIPIGKVEANISDLLSENLEENFIADTTTGNCFIVWRKNDIDLGFDMLDFTTGASVTRKFTVKNYTPYDTYIPDDAYYTVPAGQKFHFTTSFDYNFDFNEITGKKNIRVDSLYVGQSQVSCQYALNDIPVSETMPLKMTIHFPEIDQLRDYTIEKLIFTNQGSFLEDLTDYLVRFQENTNITLLTIDFDITSDGTLTVSKNSSIDLTAKFQLIHSGSAWGYFYDEGTLSSESISEDIPTELFTNPNILNNKLLFTNPQIMFDIRSNIGIPLVLNFDSIYAVGSNGEEVWADFNGQTNYGITLPMPTEEYSVVHQIFKFDRQNGGTHRLFQINPQEFFYKYSLTMDNISESGIAHHFLVDPVILMMDMELLFPLQLDPTSFFEYEDTIESDFQELLGMDTLPNNIQFDFIRVYIDAANHLPLGVNIDAVFYDENHVELYRKENIEVAASKVNSEGEAIEDAVCTTVLSFEQDDLETILKTKNILVKARIAGYDESSMIKIMMNDRLKINLSLFTKTSISLNQPE